MKIMDVAKGTIARETSTDEAGRFQCHQYRAGPVSHHYREDRLQEGRTQGHPGCQRQAGCRTDQARCRPVTEVLSVNAELHPVVTDEHHGKGVPGRPNADFGAAHERPQLGRR